MKTAYVRLRALQQIACLLVVMLSTSGVAAAKDADSDAGKGCLDCHADKQQGFAGPHAFGSHACVTCHAGNERAAARDVAHNGLIAFPGKLDNAGQACGTCHADRVSGVTHNLMHTGHGIVATTRRLIEGEAGPPASRNLQSLGHDVADSMLRKLCASCHLGQEKTEHRLDVTRDRGGGCLACHINDYPDEGHPALTAKVSDARCFGCHSRSGRISLSYAGFAEVIDATDDTRRLADGRHVERQPADVHYLAGMSCIDCHTSVGLMGDAGEATHQRQAVDIECADCHDNREPRLGLADWPAGLRGMARHLAFEADDASRFLATRRNGTPLWNIELRADGAWLHTKLTGRTLRIPAPQPADHAQNGEHDRLTCAACHSQWVPQCFGCHMAFDPESSQWDHVEQAVTPGRWSEERADVRNGPGALGVNEKGRIEPFVPGMIMTLTHPELDDERFLRVFAPLSPHTTGPSRSCESCHRSSVAVGLGEGRIDEKGGKLDFLPEHPLRRDGLPRDAWTNLDGSRSGTAPQPGQRPLDAGEIESVLTAPVTGPAAGSGDR